MYLLEKDLNNVLITFLKRLQNLKQETAENETEMAEKSRWEHAANRRQKPGLVWRNRKKISQIIKDYFGLPFFLLIILCFKPRRGKRSGGGRGVTGGCTAHLLYNEKLSSVVKTCAISLFLYEKDIFPIEITYSGEIRIRTMSKMEQSYVCSPCPV